MNKIKQTEIFLDQYTRTIVNIMRWDNNEFLYVLDNPDNLDEENINKIKNEKKPYVNEYFPLSLGIAEYNMSINPDNQEIRDYRNKIVEDYYDYQALNLSFSVELLLGFDNLYKHLESLKMMYQENDKYRNEISDIIQNFELGFRVARILDFETAQKFYIDNTKKILDNKREKSAIIEKNNSKYINF